jgi:N-acetylmuramoyl-L-alanine amidase
MECVLGRPIDRARDALRSTRVVSDLVTRSIDSLTPSARVVSSAPPRGWVLTGDRTRRICELCANSFRGVYSLAYVVSRPAVTIAAIVGAASISGAAAVLAAAAVLGGAGAAGAADDSSSTRSTESTNLAAVEVDGPDRFDVVVLDAGHGGHDEGATGPSGLREKDLVLDVTRRLADRLGRRGVRVVLTRKSDRFLSLEERTAVANDARADLFVSIHANASSSRKPKGIETFFASLDATDDDARKTAERENKAFGPEAQTFDRDDPLAAILGDLIETQHLQESSEFAKLAQHELAEIGRARSRGVKQAPFVVLMGVQMPASLVEIGFLTNPAEEKGLRRATQRDAIADALADAIRAFAERYDARRGVRELGAAGRPPRRADF